MFGNFFFQEREDWTAQVADNSARGAIAWGTAHSHGWGEIVIEDAIDFGLTFVHQPIVLYGFALDDDEQLVDGHYPRCSGGVFHWITDENDFYVGAHVFVTVATADPILAAQSAQFDMVLDDWGVDPGYDITHSWMFSGLAIKEMM